MILSRECFPFLVVSWPVRAHSFERQSIESSQLENTHQRSPLRNDIGTQFWKFNFVCFTVSFASQFRLPPAVLLLQ